MIAFLDGVVAEVREASAVIQAGPFGLEVNAPKGTLMGLQRGATVRLHTHLEVKEDDLSLYGFHTGDLLELFRYLIGVSGVGPKLALAILGSLPTTLIATAILQEDPGLLTAAPGVGKRLAERIVLELKTKLPETLLVDVGGGAGRPSSALTPAGEDAVAALLALGYREAQVKGVVAELSARGADEAAEALIRKALAKLR